MAIHAREPSAIETSTNWPSPERSRSRSAARMPKAAISAPPPMSAIWPPARGCGVLPRRLHGRAAAVAGQPEQAYQPEVVHVVAAAVAQRAVLPVAGDRAVDELLVLLAQALVADAEAVEHARPEGLQQHVGVADEAQQDLAALIALEVEPDRALPAVEREERRRVGPLLGALVEGRRPAHVVAH